MSNTFDPNDPSNLTKMATVPRKVIRNLERDAQAGREAVAKLAEIERLGAFTTAGVAMDHPAAGYFVRGYTGDQNPEAIKAEWQKIAGAGSAATGEMTQQHTTQYDAELAALQGGQALVTGQGVPTADKVAERNAKLAALSPSDPRYDEKFQTIAREYGTVFGDLVG